MMTPLQKFILRQVPNMVLFATLLFSIVIGG
jgi:hypothetical protein